MLGNMIIAGGPLALQYDFASTSSPVQLERASWRAPASARAATLVARDPYNEVIESFTVQIIGASEAAVWSAYNDFVNFMAGISQARQKPDYDIYLFKIVAVSGLADQWVSMITGPADINTPVVGPPSDPATDAAALWCMRGVSVTFRRKGRLIKPDWLTDGIGATPSTVNADQYGTYDLTFPAQNVDSVVQLALGVTAGATRTEVPAGAVLISNYAPGTASWQFGPVPITGVAGSGWQNAGQNDSVYRPQPTSSSLVSRWVAPDNNQQISNDMTISPTIKWRRALVIIRAVNNVSGAGLITKIQLKTPDGIIVDTETAPVNGDFTVKTINLGIVAGPPNGFTTFRVVNQNTTGALSDMLIERVIFINLDQPSVAIFTHGRMPVYSSYLLDPRYTTHIAPVWCGASGLNYTTRGYPGSLRGDMHFSVRHPGVRLLWLKGSGRYWDWIDNGGARVTFSASGTVFPSTLTPR